MELNPKPDSSEFVYLCDAEAFATTPIGDIDTNLNSNYGNTSTVIHDGNNYDSNTIKFYNSYYPKIAPD